MSETAPVIECRGLVKRFSEGDLDVLVLDGIDLTLAPGQQLAVVGASGSGKSALALQMMAMGAMLIGDDQVRIKKAGEGLSLGQPPNIAGQIEARSTHTVVPPDRNGIALD